MLEKHFPITTETHKSKFRTKYPQGAGSNLVRATEKHTHKTKIILTEQWFKVKSKTTATSCGQFLYDSKLNLFLSSGANYVMV